MKILVTGGTGVVGAATIPALLLAGHQVRLLSRHADRDAGGFPGGVEPFVADIADPQPLRSAVAGCECVVHIAGIVDEVPPEITFERLNVDGTRHLLAAATAGGAPYFIYLSSLGAERGESDYHRSKRDAEALVREYCGNWLILRPGNVYGPGDEVLSMLVKMVRTLPAIPVVDDGEQPFQPIWHADLAAAIARAVDDRSLAGRTLELSGVDVTTTNDVLARFSAITGREPSRLAIPAWLARVGTEMLASLGALGQKLQQRAKVPAPLNRAKLSMLLEGSVIADPAENALTEVFHLTPTPLQDGLEMLADALPEQLPGDGVGEISHVSYVAEIVGSSHRAEALLAQVCERLADLMPMDFAAEPGAPRAAEEGATMTGDIKGRGHVQVRLEEKTPTRATFVTLEGHPLAGVMQLAAEDLPEGVRFSVNTISQPSNAFDWLALNTVGGYMQRQNWRNVVRRVVEMSGGEAPSGVQVERRAVEGRERDELHEWVERLVQRQARTRRADTAETTAAQ